VRLVVGDFCRSRPRSSGRRVDKAFLFPTPRRGAALAPTTGPRGISFSATTTTKCRIRRLPRMAQPEDLPMAPIRSNRALDLQTVGSFPGAACFCTFRPEWYCDEIREGGEMSAKAAPLQALGNRPLHQRATRSIEGRGEPQTVTAYPTRLIVQSG
jgi:hypothetical protein